MTMIEPWRINEPRQLLQGRDGRKLVKAVNDDYRPAGITPVLCPG